MNLDELLDTPEVPEQPPSFNLSEGIVGDDDTTELPTETGNEESEGNVIAATTTESLSLNELNEIPLIKPQSLNEIESQPLKPSLISIKSDVESSPEIVRERTRKGMAFTLLCILAVSVLSVLIIIPRWKINFISKYPEKDSEKVAKVIDNILDKDTINLIWTSQVTLIGTVLGFYFGSQNNSRDDD